MEHRDKLDFSDHFKIAFCLSIISKTIIIPVSLLIAQLLSAAVTQATSGNVSAVISDSLLVVALIALSAILEIGGNVAIRRRISQAMNRCKLDLLENLLNNPLHRLFSTDHGELIENLNDDITTATNRYTDLYSTMVTGVLAGIGYAVFLFIQSPLVAGSLLCISLLQLLPPIIVKKHMQINYEDCRDIEAKITDHIVEAVEGFEVIKLYDLAHWWQMKMAHFHKAYLKIGRKTDAVATAQISMYKMLDGILKYGTYALIGIYAMMETCTMEVALQAIILSNGLFDAVKSVFSSIPQVAVSQSAEKRISQWICTDTDDKGKRIPSGDQIILKDLCYGYKGTFILNGINCKYDLDTKYLIEGKNGAGKSTLMNLLAGLLLPDRGEILIGGIPTAQLGERAYPEEILYIPQIDPEFDFSINTLFEMYKRKDQEGLRQTVTRFGLTGERMETGTIRELSGGERKKVFLAIGFALNPQILLLDEPTNSLDDHGKAVFRDLLKERRRGTFVVSHDSEFRTLMDAVYTVGEGGVRNVAAR